MVSDGLTEGTGGNISARDAQSGLIVITPSAVDYADLSDEDLAVVDTEGNLVEGKWRPSSETPLHTVFYKRRPAIGAVVHTHAPYASVFAVCNEEIPLVVVEAALCLGAPVPLAPYRRPGTEELADIVFDTVGNGLAALLGQHGLLTVGHSLSEAYSATVGAEKSAKLVYMARSMGSAAVELDPDEVSELRAAYVRNYRPTETSDEGAHRE